MIFWALMAFIGTLLALMFRPTAILLGRLLFVTTFALKWIMLMGLVIALTSTPTAYEHFGMTPISLLLGDKMYAGLSPRADANLKRKHHGN